MALNVNCRDCKHSVLIVDIIGEEKIGLLYCELDQEKPPRVIDTRQNIDCLLFDDCTSRPAEDPAAKI